MWAVEIGFEVLERWAGSSDGRWWACSCLCSSRTARSTETGAPFGRGLSPSGPGARTPIRLRLPHHEVTDNDTGKREHTATMQSPQGGETETRLSRRRQRWDAIGSCSACWAEIGAHHDGRSFTRERRAVGEELLTTNTRAPALLTRERSRERRERPSQLGDRAHVDEGAARSSRRDCRVGTRGRRVPPPVGQHDKRLRRPFGPARQRLRFSRRGSPFDLRRGRGGCPANASVNEFRGPPAPKPLAQSSPRQRGDAVVHPLELGA